MRYAIPMLLFAAALCTAAFVYGGLAWLCLWPATSFLVVSCAYFLETPHWLGKRTDGTRSLWISILLLPYLWLTYALWRFDGLTVKLAHAEVVPGLWIGRRPLPAALPEGVRLVVDLTSEFRPPRYRDGVTVWCLPMLDGTPGTVAALVEAVRRVALEDGVFVHCAQGRGRSGLFVAGILMARGEAENADAAWRRITGVKPDARLNAKQRRMLRAVEAQLQSRATDGTGAA